MRTARVLLVLVLVVVLGAIAQARTGPEAPNGLGRTPTLYLQDSKGPDKTIFVPFAFTERPRGLDGYDFGGRTGYRCGFIEVVDGGLSSSLNDDVVIGKVVLEKYGPVRGDSESVNPLYSVVNSNLATGTDGPCSAIVAFEDPIPDATPEEYARSFGGPGQPSFAHSHVLQMWQDVDGIGGPAPLVEVARYTLPHAEASGDTWWFRGDEDGEVIAWYRNPDVTLPDGSNPYGPIARFSFVAMGPGVVVDDCVVGNLEGTPCPQAYPNETP